MRTTSSGFIALITVLIISAIAVTIGVGMLIRSIGETQLASIEELKQRAQLAATVCAERALYKLDLSTSYSGNETTTTESGDTCNIGVISGSGNTNRSFSTSSTVLDVTQSISITVTQINPTMQISSWQDVIN